MRALIQDIDALRAVSPSALSAFARSEGWTFAETFGEHADVYVDENKREIILPRTDRLADYPSVVSRLIRDFAGELGQDELSTYRDLVCADRDVVRVRAFGGDDDGSVQVDAGVDLVSQARDMLLAAACAAVTPQPVFRAGSNKDANDYMRRVRLGQTEHGSFIVTLLAPVPPALEPAQMALNQEWLPLQDEPLDRKVTRRLAQALEASRSAVERVFANGYSAFDSVVRSGVSANLCEAVSGLIDRAEKLEIRITWARTRPTPEKHRNIEFSKNDSEILKEVARTFRLRQPKENEKLFGVVHKLQRSPDEHVGAIAFKAVVDGRLQTVSAELDDAEYAKAVDAHRHRKPLFVVGDLERVGQRWRMIQPQILEAESDDATDDDGEDPEEKIGTISSP